MNLKDFETFGWKLISDEYGKFRFSLGSLNTPSNPTQKFICLEKDKYHIKKGMVHAYYFVRCENHFNNFYIPHKKDSIQSINFSESKTVKQGFNDINKRLMPCAEDYFKNAEKYINSYYDKKTQIEIFTDKFKKVGFRNNGISRFETELSRKIEGYKNAHIMGRFNEGYSLTIDDLTPQEIFDILGFLDGVKYGNF